MSAPLPVPSLGWSLSAFSLCIGAVLFKSQQQLAVWTAVSTLDANVSPEDPTPPKPVVRSDGETNRPILRAIYRRFTRSKVTGFLFTLLIMASIMFLIAWVLPRFTTTLFLDIFWGSVQFWLLSSVCNTAISTIVPKPQSIRYNLSTPASPLTFKREDIPNLTPTLLQRPNIRLATSIILSFATLGSAFEGYDGVLTIIPALWVVNLAVTFPTMRLKRIVQYQMAIATVFASIVPIIALVAWIGETYFPPSSSSPSPSPEIEDEPSTKIATPSPWLNQVMLLFNVSYQIIPPAMIIYQTYRYEFSKTHSLQVVEPEFDGGLGTTLPIGLKGSSTEKTAPKIAGAPNVIPPLSSIPAFYHPLTNAAVIALSVVCLGLAILPSIVPSTAGMITTSPIGLAGTTPAVVCAITLTSLWNGEFKSWWEYSEIWIPKRDEATVDDARDVEDVEKAIES
ncbi:hypothetical protein BCR39DRAFT_534594 [Naematelia encephala]|uniref:Uncharacterized protein n=1 Tax=Naematelia encephala TaxID=71784 RepID=A0A1Y2B1C4_9TREE|nr:hypothetical protein BCR39DRAFT_534594 [Naematelia encephala]